jgi:hypothetical protein
VVTQAHDALERLADRVFGVYTTAGEERVVLIKIQEAGMQRRLADLLQQRRICRGEPGNGGGGHWSARQEPPKEILDGV